MKQYFRRNKMNIFTYLLENPDYILEKTFQHLYIFIISWSFAVITGIIAGIFITREKNKKIGRIILVITGITQSVPSIAVIALFFLFMGIGFITAAFALFLYSLVPIVFNTASGLISVDGNVKEAALGMGMTKKDILFKIEIPMAMPSVFSGIRNSAVINIATATVAATIGAGGLGVIIFTGLSHFNASMIFAGSVPVSLLALSIDLILGFLEKKFTSEGLKISKEG